MKLYKSAQVEALTLSEDDLAQINTHTLRDLTAEEVFAFKLRLCDNEIDRDLERFSVDAMQGLAKLYLGKPVIQDHDPTAAKQTARIFATEVVQDVERKTSLGEAYTSLIAKAYMVRTGSNADQIKEIEAGIKKEVSVGCSVRRRSCSVCGSEKDRCKHVSGRTYDGIYCHRLLNDPDDAYEASFVAVPAQRNAGTTKNHDTDDDPDDNTNENAVKALRDIDMLDAFIFCEKEKG